MSEFSFPFTGGAGGDDGPYSAPFFAGMMEALFQQSGTSGNDNSVIFGTGGANDPLEVTQTSPASNEVEVKAGKALVQGYYYHNDADINILVPANVDGSGFDRIDTIVLEIDFIAQTVRAEIVTGTPAGSPVAPTLTQNSTTWQVPLANIDVPNLFITILDANIDNTVKVGYVKWNVEQGGTGVVTNVAGNLLVGNGANSLTALTPPTDYSYLIGDTAKTEKMRFVSMRNAIIKGSTGPALGTATSGTVIPLNTTPVFDPNSWITSIASNQFFLTAGVYWISAYMHVFNQSGAARTAIAWIHNATTTAVVVQGQVVFFDVPNAGQMLVVPRSRLVISNGTDAFELRAFGSGGTMAVSANALTPSPTNGYAGHTTAIFIEKVAI